MKRTSKNTGDLLLTMKSNTRNDVLLSEDQILDILSESRSSSVIVIAPKNYKAVAFAVSILIGGILLFTFSNKGSQHENIAGINSNRERIADEVVKPTMPEISSTILPASHRDIEKHPARIFNKKSEEKNESPVQDDISSPQYISLSAAELVNLKTLMGSPTQTTESVPSRMIPVHVRSETEKNSEAFLWYYPTKEFISALPERYRLSLEKELAVIEEAEKKNLCAGDVCQKLTAPSFFDYCRSQSGVIERSSLIMNSDLKQAVAELDLSESRMVSVSVYDQSGKFISKIMTGRAVESGVQQVKIDLKSLSKGAYLLAISTEKGEQVIQRIIVQ